jgi:hypothetical protein
MTPKEKAIEIYSKCCYFASFWMDQNDAKQCALIAQRNLLDKLKSLNIKDEYEENVLSEIEKL